MNIPQQHLHLQQSRAEIGHQPDRSPLRPGVPPFCDGLRSHGIIKLTMHRAYMTSVRPMFPSHVLPLAIDQTAHDRGRDFPFAQTAPNLRLTGEGDKDGYR